MSTPAPRVLDLPRVIGHRGAAAAAPENTLASLHKAHELGARWVEFDVKLSRDGHPILAHDDRLERTTSGSGRFAERTLAEIERLDAGSWFAPAFAGERVPRLEEALALCRELGLGINLEIKPCRGRALETARVALETLLPDWPDDLPLPLISSFVPACLAIAREIAPEVPRGYLAGRLPWRWQERLAVYGCSTLNLDHRQLLVRQRAAVVATGVPLLLYTVNDPGMVREQLSNGVSAVFTDRVAEVLAALDGGAAASNGASGRPGGPAP
jgi:glycerophosphoryl diester phosphodiesterase